MTFASIFTPDHVRYEGVRPFNIWALRVNYFLMVAFVATDAWNRILTHEGAWQPMSAIAWCVWAAYPTLALLGLMRPLKMLPIMMFTIFYKTLFLTIVSLPLWRAGALAGSPAEGMTKAFLWMPILLLAMPWGYVYRTYISLPKVTAIRATELNRQVS